jgi:hypothetical protein
MVGQGVGGWGLTKNKNNKHGQVRNILSRKQGCERQKTSFTLCVGNGVGRGPVGCGVGQGDGIVPGGRVGWRVASVAVAWCSSFGRIKFPVGWATCAFMTPDDDVAKVVGEIVGVSALPCTDSSTSDRKFLSLRAGMVP